MNQEEGKKIRLGIFVTIAIVLMVLAIYFIGSRQYLFSSTFQVSAEFSDVGGLQPGNNVRISGINIGTIKGLEITSDSTVRVDMQIQKNAQQFIKADATATIGNEGLMGNKVINIRAGSEQASTIENKATISAIAPVNVDDIMVNLQATSEHAALITYDIANITAHISEGKGAIGKLLIDSTFAQSLDQTLRNAQSATSGLDENMEAAKDNFLLRGYFNRQEKEKEKAEKEAEKERKKAEKEAEKDDDDKGGFLWW